MTVSQHHPNPSRQFSGLWLLVLVLVGACESRVGAPHPATSPESLKPPGAPSAASVVEDGKAQAAPPERARAGELGRPARGGEPAVPIGTGGVRELAVPGFLPAVVYLPEARGPRPVLVATHGAGGHPEYDCEHWRELTCGRAVLLCLRGAETRNAMVGGYYYPTHHELSAELRAALAALEFTWRDRIRAGSYVYAGFSQGASMGTNALQEARLDFPRWILLEGGYDYWTRGSARSVARVGTERVLFVCGTQYCSTRVERPVHWLREAGVAVQAETALGAGHTPAGGVQERTVRALPWLLQGDRAWEALNLANGCNGPV